MRRILTGNSDFKGADLCEILFEIEEAKESKTAGKFLIILNK